MKKKNRINCSIVVMGLGTFGYQTAKALYEGGADVLAIDSDEIKVDRIRDSATNAICADVTNTDALRSCGAFDVDVAVVALRRHFDTSVLVTHSLEKEGVEKILVQVDTEQEAEAIQAVGATSVIFPERDMAERVARTILMPGIADHIPLGSGVSIIEMQIPEEFVGKTLVELNVRNRFDVTVIAVSSETGGEQHVEVPPSPDERLKAGSSLVVMGKTDRLKEFKERFEF